MLRTDSFSGIWLTNAYRDSFSVPREMFDRVRHPCAERIDQLLRNTQNDYSDIFDILTVLSCTILIPYTIHTAGIYRFDRKRRATDDDPTPRV